MQSKVAKNQTKSTGIKVFNNLINSDLMRTKIHQMVGATDSQEFITMYYKCSQHKPCTR